MHYSVYVLRVLTVSLSVPVLSRLYNIYRMAETERDVWLYGYMHLLIAFFSLFPIIPRNKSFNTNRKYIYAYMFQNKKISEEILSDYHIRKWYQENTKTLDRKV